MFSQNLQVLYDFGKTKDGTTLVSHQYITSTLEFFKPDSNGNTFVFVDMNYDMANGGVNTVYWEISRDLRFWKFPLELHLEFTGGNFVDGATNYGGYIGRSWIVGINHPFSIGKSSFSGALLYRSFKDAISPDAQFTGVWFIPLFNYKVTMSGFIDIWTTDNFILNGQGAPDGKTLRVLTQPQFWYNIDKHFSVGSEIDISRHFITFDGDFDFMPTVAAKWTF